MPYAVRPLLAIATALALPALSATPAVASPDVLPAPALFGSVPWTDHASDSATLATDAAGNTFAAYDETTDVARISLVERPVGQLAYGAPITVVTLAGGHTLPVGEQIASDDAGDITVLWIDRNGTDSRQHLWVATKPAAASTFDPPVELAPDAGAFFDVQLGVSAGGAATVVWSGNNQADGIQVASRPAGGTFGTPATVTAGGPGGDSQPTLAVGSNGAIAITWIHIGGDDPAHPENDGVISSWIVRRPAGSTSFDLVAQLTASTPNGVPGDALPAVSPDGTVTVAYELDDRFGNPADIVTRVAPPGAGLSAEEELVPTVEFQHSTKVLEAVQADHSSNATVVWLGTSAGTTSLHFTSTPGSLGFFGLGIDSTIPVAPGSGVGDVETSADGLGGVHAAWTETSSSATGSVTTVHHAIRAAAGPATPASWPAFPAVSATTDFAPVAASRNALVSISADPFGDTSVAWGRSSALVDHAGPIATAIQGSNFANYDTPATYSVSGSDPYSAPVSIHWTFGDGGTADGPSVSHTFAKPAKVLSLPQPQTLVTATLTDAAGNVTTRTLRVTLSVFHTGPVKSTIPAATRPTLTLALSRPQFAGGSAKAAIDHGKLHGKAGATLTATASAAGSVSFQLAAYVAGHRAGSRCAAGRPTRHQSPCQATRGFKDAPDIDVAAGANTFRLTGRWGHKALAPGRYRLRGYLGAAGVSLAAQVDFRITH